MFRNRGCTLERRGEGRSCFLKVTDLLLLVAMPDWREFGGDGRPEHAGERGGVTRSPGLPPHHNLKQQHENGSEPKTGPPEELS